MVLNGRLTADYICLELKERCDRLKRANVNPQLTIYTNDDPASQVYVRNKVGRCEEVGIDVRCVRAESLVRMDAPAATPYIIQEPALIAPHNVAFYTSTNIDADVDGFSTYNMGRLATGNNPIFEPCTPKGVVRLLDVYHIDLDRLNALVIGRSNIVGRPMAMMLEHAGCTVTVAHSRTPEPWLYQYADIADIIVSAVGKVDVLKDGRDTELLGCSIDWSNKIVIDIGMNRDANGKLCGDIAESLKQKSAWYTPVPNGIGPMTIAMLLENVIEYYENRLDRVLNV